MLHQRDPEEHLRNQYEIISFEQQENHKSKQNTTAGSSFLPLVLTSVVCDAGTGTVCDGCTTGLPIKPCAL